MIQLLTERQESESGSPLKNIETPPIVRKEEEGGSNGVELKEENIERGVLAGDDQPPMETEPSTYRADNIQTEQEKEYEFFNNYSKIRMNQNADFYDRMNFDIYKRMTRQQRYTYILIYNRFDVFVETNKKRIPLSQKNETFNRLIEDSNRRVQRKHLMAQQVDAEIEESREGQKKMTQDEMDEIYTNLMNKHKGINELTEEKRKLKQMADELQLIEILNKSRHQGIVFS